MNKKDSTNPFQFGVVIDDSAFCNRKEEILDLKSKIKNGYSTWLFSPRRFGKTSLIEKVFRELKDVSCIYIDLYNIKSKDDFCRRYAKIIARELFNWKDDINVLSAKLGKAFRKLSPVISFDEAGNTSVSLNVAKIEREEDIETILEVPYKISQKSKKRICIAFDEFQEISRIDPFMLHWMRSAFQRHREISYIFLGSKQSLMEEIFTSNKSPFYEFASKMDLKEICRKELFQFISRNFRQKGLMIEDFTINTILDRSECQPHFTQYFASVVFDLISMGYKDGREDFSDLWLDRIIRPQRDIFQDIFDQLTNSQRITLQALSAELSKGIFSEASRIRYNLPVSSSLSEVLKALQKKGLVYKMDEEYRITNPVFKEWLFRLGG